jgi:hypothetical protein
MLGAILLATAAVSCSSDSTGPQPPSCLEETSSVNATISVGTSVTFDWTPACPVALLVVEGESSGHDVWWIATFGAGDSEIVPTTANRIVPPITFGQVPSTATSAFGPEPMVAGTIYRVVLWRNLPAGSSLRCQQNAGTGCLLAAKSFTR